MSIPSVDNSIARLSFICSILLLLISPSSLLFAAPTDRDNSAIILQLKWQHQFQFAGYYAALEKKYYEQAGLNVEIREAKSSEVSIETVLKGDAHFGIAMSDLLLHRNQGDPVVALAAIYQHSPLILLSRQDSGISSVHDLIGKELMLEGHAEELLAYLESEGIPASQLNIRPHSYDVSQLLNREVDVISAYSTDEPFALVSQGIAYNQFSPRSVGIDFYGDTLFSTEEFIEKHPQKVKKFLAATLKGWRYAMDNPEEIADLILEKYSRRHSREHLLFEAEQSRKLVLDNVVEIGYMNPGRWESIADVYVDLGMLPEDYSLDGFIYEKYPQQDLTNFYLILSTVGFFLAVTFIVAARFFALNKALNENQRTLSTLMSNLPGMVYRCKNDPEWSMMFISDGVAMLTGHAPDELVDNRNQSFASLIHPDDRETVYTTVQNAVEKKKAFQTSYRITTKDHKEKWVWEQGQGIFSASGECKFLEGFITDISPQKHIEHEKELLIENLQDTLEQIKKLQGIIPICSYCKQIRDDKGSWNQLEKYFEDHSEASFSHGICDCCLEKFAKEKKLGSPDNSKQP